MKEIIDGIKNKTEQATKNPGARFGILYIYVLAVGLIIGLYYLSNIENVSRQTVPPVIPDTTVVTDLAVKNAVDVPPINLNEVSKSSPELLAEGEKLFKTNCASCHGENGAGGGPASAGMNPAPRNFTSKDNWKNGTKLSGIYTTLQEGLLPSAMISYDFLLPKEKFAIAHYIRETFIPGAEADTDGDLQALDATYNLSGGLKLAAQIPVKSASLIVLNENKNKIDTIEKTIESLKLLKNDAGLNVFEKVVKNQKTALMFLAGNQNWKSGESAFVNLLVNNVNQNGFNGALFNLSSNEWTQLYNFVNKLI